jgi:hypothetical protein
MDANTFLSGCSILAFGIPLWVGLWLLVIMCAKYMKGDPDE